MAAVVDAIPALAPAPRPVRPRVVLIGTVLVIGACLMAFAGLMGVYLTNRSATLHAHKPWFAATTHIPLSPGTMALFTLLLSLVTMQWAVYAVRNNDRKHAILALGITMLFGICAINSVTFLFHQAGVGVASASGMLLYVISGFYIAMAVASLIFSFLMTFRTLGGQYSGRDHDGILAASFFWYATVAVYAVIWYAIFVNK